jgi:hypothetical protein
MENFATFQNRCTNKVCNYRATVEIEFPQMFGAEYEYTCPECGEVIVVLDKIGDRDPYDKNPERGEVRAERKK